jgi:hypothetical protein
MAFSHVTLGLVLSAVLRRMSVRRTIRRRVIEAPSHATKRRRSRLRHSARVRGARQQANRGVPVRARSRLCQLRRRPAGFGPGTPTSLHTPATRLSRGE